MNFQLAKLSFSRTEISNGSGMIPCDQMQVSEKDAHSRKKFLQSMIKY